MIPGQYDGIQPGRRIIPPNLFDPNRGPTPGNPGAARLFERPPVFGYDLITDVIATEWTGAALVAFPNTARIAQSQPFQSDVGLFGMVLVCSLVNDQADTRFGVWAAIDTGTALDLRGASHVFLGAVTQQNSSAGGVPNPSSKTANLSFGENSAIRVNSGQRIALYACGTNIGQLGAATLTLFSILLSKGQN